MNFSAWSGLFGPGLFWDVPGDSFGSALSVMSLLGVVVGVDWVVSSSISSESFEMLMSKSSLQTTVCANVVALWVAALKCFTIWHAFTMSGALSMVSLSFCSARCLAYYNRNVY